MITTYCTYGLHNDETWSCLEIGDSVKEIKYFDENNIIKILNDMIVTYINEDLVKLESSDLDEIIIKVKDIVNWELEE